MAYLVLRGIFVPMLHDEIATFFRYVHIHEVFPWFSEWSANNHYLNSLLSWVSYQLFGSSPLALRLTNLIFFPLYFYFSWRIAGLLKNPWLKYGLLISLLFAHNYLEFFGTSRGYGMSMALLTGAIGFTMLAMKEPKPRYTVYVMLSLVLATYANLTIMNSFILITGLLLLVLIVHGEKRGIFTHTFLLLVTGIAPIVFFIKLLFRLQAEGELHYGKPDGFVTVSMASIGKLLTGYDHVMVIIIPMVLFGIALLIFMFIALKYIQTGEAGKLISHEWIFLYLLAGNVVASVLENKLFGTNYPEDRTGLYFYPLLAGSVFFSLDQLRISNGWKSLLPAIPFIFFPVHFLANMNLSWSSLENQAIPERFHQTVQSEISPSGFPATIQGYQGRVMRWAFMNFRTGSEAGLIHFSGYPSTDGDFQVVFAGDYLAWSDHYDFIDQDKRSGLSLLKRKNNLTRTMIFQQKDIVSGQSVTDEFFELSRGTIDSLSGRSLYFGFDLELTSPARPFHSWVVATVYDNDGNTAKYEFLPLDWYRTDWSEPGKSFRNGLLIQDIPENALDYVIYIWNIRKVPFEVHQADFSLFRLNKDD